MKQGGSNTWNRNLCRVLTIFFLVAAFGCSGCAATDIPQSPAKTQVLLYIVGSDLESKHGTDTSHLKNIAKSYENGNPRELDIVAAFGGANKDGWRGMNIATIEQIREDAKDGVFGNGQYLYSDSSADMGSGESFLKFLELTKKHRPAEKSFLIVADHGGSYKGIGWDEITKNKLGMSDIDQSLRQVALPLDSIMFDACYMGSMEVGKTVQPHTRLMLGSEETQWGGFKYEKMIIPLVSNPDTDPTTIGKYIVDSYIARNPDSGNIKTMSIIDTSQLPAIRDSLDELGQKLSPLCDTNDGLHDLKGAYNDAIRLGTSTGRKPTAVDLVSLLLNIEKKRPELTPEVQKTIALIKKAVVYEKHNEYSEEVYGISIASPDGMDLAKYKSLGDSVRIAPHWDEFFKKIVVASHSISSDTVTVPDVTISSDDYSGTKEVAEALPDDKITLKRPSFTRKENGTFVLVDPYDDASVYAVYYRINGKDAQSIGSQPVRPGADGQYHLPAWDGRWYYFPDPGRRQAPLWDLPWMNLADCVRSVQPFLVDVEYEGKTVGGFESYTSWISIEYRQDRTDATLVTFVNSSKNQHEMMIEPYYITENGDDLFGDSMEKFIPGSLVTSYTTGFDVKTLKPGDYVLARTTVGSDMAMEYTILPDGTFAAGIMAYYDNDREVLANQFRVLTIKNGAVISSTIGPLPQVG